MCFSLTFEYGCCRFTGVHIKQTRKPCDQKPEMCMIAHCPRSNCCCKLPALGEDLLFFRPLQGFQIGS